MTSKRRSYANPRDARAGAAAVAALALLLLVAACATLRPASPEIVAATVRVVELRFPSIRFDVDLELLNPNRFEIAVASLEAELTVAGERTGTARLAAPVALPAGATATVRIEARGDASAALAGLGRALGGARPLDYRLRGAIVLADGTRFPFSRGGEVAAPRGP